MGGKLMKIGLRTVSLLAAAGFAFASSPAFADELRIVSWGGAYQKGQSIGIFQPAAKALGITVFSHSGDACKPHNCCKICFFDLQ